MPRFIRLSAVAAAAAVILSACTHAPATSGSSSSAPYTPPSPPASGISPTPPATPAGPLPSSGASTASCIHGWISPKPGSDTYEFPLKVIQNTVPMKGQVVVVEMRYFRGPESPPSTAPESLVVQRWYVKLYDAKDLRYQGRFLVERRILGSGVSAVAPYDTTGFNSPNWTAFQWNSADPTPKAYSGIPGKWAGIPYDFVNGGQGLHVSGLPSQVTGCMAGT